MSVQYLLYFYFILLPCSHGIEAEDGSVCFNNCSGHGDCRDYSCHCWIGYHGDDCSTTFADGNNLVPILTAGSFNITKRNFTSTIKKYNYLLLGLSSYNCHKCIIVEPEYVKITEQLQSLKVPFARGDIDTLKYQFSDNFITQLPSLVFYKKSKSVLYQGMHTVAAVAGYVKKQLGKPVTILSRKQDVTAFINNRNSPDHALSTVVVIGFFVDVEGLEEDDYNDFVDTAKELQLREDVYFGAVTALETSTWFKHNKTIDRTPSVMLVGEGDLVHTVNLDEFYGEKISLREWIVQRAVPLVGRLSEGNFKLYEKIGLPMLMIFLDLSQEDQAIGSMVVGGKSGGILNEVLLEEFRAAAKEHVGRLLFVYLDGVKHEDQMRSLGLYGGKERLPSLAFNTKDGSQIPFPENLPINKDTLLQFCADFISGKLKNKWDAEEMARKALQATNPINQKNKAVRKEVRKPPEKVRGVAEQFGDGDVGDSAITVVTAKDFKDIVMSDDRDVLLLLHAKNCESCAHFAVYYKRMAERFKDLNIPSLTIARMDVTEETPPSELNLIVGALPLILLLPAYEKRPPWLYYSGVGKIQPLMKWVQQHVSIPFSLPDLPHLKESDRILYKQQIREREESLEEKRKQDVEEMEKEERSRQQSEEKNKNKKRKESDKKIENEIFADNIQNLDDLEL